MPLDNAQITQIESRIAEIDIILSSGASSVTVDSTSSTYNLPELRRERDSLVQRLQVGKTNKRRPICYRPRLG